jgi:hypothetical protein
MYGTTNEPLFMMNKVTRFQFTTQKSGGVTLFDHSALDLKTLAISNKLGTIGKLY